jgi:hypothetical protein
MLRLKLVEGFGPHPILANRPAVDLVNLKAIEVVGVDVELGHISSAAVLDALVPRDPDGVVAIKDRVEGRLPRQTRWPPRPTPQLQ